MNVGFDIKTGICENRPYSRFSGAAIVILPLAVQARALLNGSPPFDARGVAREALVRHKGDIKLPPFRGAALCTGGRGGETEEQRKNKEPALHNQDKM